MQINELTLVNYRSFSERKIIFDKDLTVIIGKNGVGKSNILEALSYISGIRSNRVETDRDLVRFDCAEAKIKGVVRVDGEEKGLIVNLQIANGRVGKSFYIDEFKKRLIDFVQICSVIVFEPTDLDLVSGSPSLRRRHLDRFLSALDAKYWRSITTYGKIVARRNRLLVRVGEGRAKPVELGFWDSRLVDYARFISRIRQEFFEYLNFVEPTFVKAAQGKHAYLTDLSWILKQSELSEEKLKVNHERDIAAGMTLSGPHRDDFKFIFRGRDLGFFGSRGEMRMGVLALKLAELEFFRVKRGFRPILALDDIFSELDWEHRETVLSVIGNQQTIITAAEEESVPKEIFKKAKIIHI